jgi:hypothetical protein
MASNPNAQGSLAQKQTKPSNPPKGRQRRASELEPIETIKGIFKHMLDKVKKNYETGLDDPLNQVEGRLIWTGTMCSGTKCPIIVLKLFRECELMRMCVFKSGCLTDLVLKQSGKEIKFDHYMSVEVKPFKQAYIQQNWPELLLFRDVAEVARGIREAGQEA